MNSKKIEERVRLNIAIDEQSAPVMYLGVMGVFACTVLAALIYSNPTFIFSVMLLTFCFAAYLQFRWYARICRSFARSWKISQAEILEVGTRIKKDSYSVEWVDYTVTFQFPLDKEWEYPTFASVNEIGAYSLTYACESETHPEKFFNLRASVARSMYDKVEAQRKLAVCYTAIDPRVALLEGEHGFDEVLLEIQDHPQNQAP